ncbi:MAG: DUF3149 domain-containing protein [Kangiellaceae bacterium]|nr:DUF3149 domain-containing protein [Kangiellaceae bacterium]
MEIIKELFSNPFGIMSAIVIFVMLGMAGYFVWLFIKKSGEPPKE